MKNNSPAFFNGLIKALITLTAVIILTACGPAAVEPQEPELPQPSATATVLPTPEPTPTSTPVVLEGRLFFDMNGSGLRDEASFQYDSARLADERQPLQTDLLAAINAYLAEHPDLKDGDLVTLEEPALSGYTVCAGSNCVTTNDEGGFQLVKQDVDRSLDIKIEDPNAGTPALEMRYVNKWKRAVTVRAYEMNGVQVPEQHLNDTAIFKLVDGATIQPNNPNEIGLMQGFLTMPFPIGVESFIWTWYDHDPRIGYGVNWIGKESASKYDNRVKIYDNHYGVDWLIPEGTFFVAPAPAIVREIYLVSNDPNAPQDDANITLEHPETGLFTHYGHVRYSSLAIKIGDKLTRGQYIGTPNVATSGPGDYPYTNMLHGQIQCCFHIQFPLSQSEVFDYYRSESNPSYWTTDNIPQYFP